MSTSRASWGLGLVLACSGPVEQPGPGEAPGGTGGDSDSGHAPGGGSDSADAPLEVEPPAPELTAEEVGQALVGALAGGIPEPVTARREYVARFEGRDADCPGGSYNLAGNFEGCETETGWIYAGLVEFTGPDDPENFTREFHVLGDGWIQDPDGKRMVMGGELSFTPEGSGWTGGITGTWSWPLAEGWMQPEQAGGVLEIAVTGSGPGRTVAVSGSVAGQPWAVVLDAAVAQGEVCDGEPLGAFLLRGEGGYWYRLERDEAGCACGSVVYAGGEELGEACPELAGPFEALGEVTR